MIRPWPLRRGPTETLTPSAQPGAAPEPRRRIREHAQRVRSRLSIRTRLKRLRQSRHTRRRVRLVLTCLALLVVLPIVVWLVGRQGIPDATDTLPVQGAQVEVISGNGFVYSATAGGRITVVDSARNKVIRAGELGHPVTALALRSGALFALGPGKISRLSERGVRELTEEFKSVRPTRLAAGPKGVWATGGGQHVAVQINPQTLKIRARVELPGRAGGIAVTRKGAWVSQPDLDLVVKIGLDGPGGFKRVGQVRVPGRPGPVAAAGGKVIVLAQAAHRLAWFDESTPRAPRRVPVDPTAALLAASASSAWTISPTNSEATEIDLEAGRTVGRPVGIAAAPRAATADLDTVWTTSTRESALMRIDLVQLDVARERRREWNTPWGLHPGVYVGSAACGLLLWLMWMASWRRTDPNAGLPRYELGSRIRVVALNMKEWKPLLLTGERKRQRKWTEVSGGGGVKDFFARLSRGSEDEFEGESEHAQVLRTIGSLLRIDSLVLLSLSYVNGARRRRLPFRRGPRPPAIRRRFRKAGPRRLCVLRGSWRVDELGERFLLRLDRLFDKVRGDWVPVPVPEEVWLHVECDREWLTELGVQDIVAGAEVDLDMLALSCRMNGDDEPMRLTMIAAYQRLNG